MANLSENPQWVDGIYQIETSDPVVGGPDGVSNRQAKELASRTRYLKKEQEKTGSDLATHAAAADPHTQYAPKANPTFTGTPKAPTPAADSNSQQVATTAFVKSVAAALVNGAPAALDTLQELAKAMGNDPNFSATVLGELAKKLSLSGGTLTGELLLSAANALRLVYGDYGVIIRNDGNRFYLLLTNKGDKTGSYNSLRPLDINLATGDITVGHNLNVTGLLNEKGQRVYSPNNKPTAADVGAITKSDADNNYVRQGLSGVIYQKDELPWNSPTGVYLKDNVTHSSLIWHMGANTGSASAAQFYFDFANGGIKYRSSRDNFGFEKTWARIYSDQDKPTAADIGALPVAGTAVAATKLATPRKINGVVFDGSADITLTPANLGLREIIETGSGSGFYWRKYSDRVIEIFARVDVITGTNQTISFPVKTNGVIFILANDFGGYSGPNAYTVRPYNVTDSGFSVYWDRFNENGGGNKKSLYYHVIANSL
ncbi:hypothetical protein Pcaca04_30570 [Pectobacterium carotovorum subsp. carotovorum]|nr:hypothetical protein Pcaca04_30570 [Pectobacterium carotovorum subsp. carotovorum]